MITGSAQAQYLGMIARYVQETPQRPSRIEAARNLIQAYDDAAELIKAGGGHTIFMHPRPYPHLASYGFRWIKVYRYWFGFVPGASPLITNIFHEAGDIPSNMSSDVVPATPA